MIDRKKMHIEEQKMSPGKRKTMIVVELCGKLPCCYIAE